MNEKIDYNKLFTENKDNILGMYINEVRHLDQEDDQKQKVLYYGVKALLNTKE